MGDYTKTIIAGNVGNDPEIKTFADGGRNAQFSIATNDRWKDAATGESKVRTEWHRVVVRDENLIKNVVEPYIKKGSKVLVEGRNETRSYDKDGGKHYTTEVVVRSFNGAIQLLADPTAKEDARDARGNSDRTTSRTNNGPAPR